MFAFLRTPEPKKAISSTTEWRTQEGVARRDQRGHRILVGERYAIITQAGKPQVYCRDCMVEGDRR